MSLLQKIKDDQLQARKQSLKEIASILTTLIGEASKIGKDDGNRESTDAEVVAVIKKFIKNINETLSVKVSSDLLLEKATLEAYLPEQLTGDDLVIAVKRACLRAEAESVRDMGKVMKELKEKHDGQYDGKEASNIVKELLK
jgi:uncharacterized protein YqeY